MQQPIFSAPLSTLLAGLVLSVAATGAMAQTTPATTSTPATVGVTPQDAAEATRKAVPRADTGTVVRTDESAADKAREAADKARNAADSASDKARNAADTVRTDTPATPNTAPTAPMNNNMDSNTNNNRDTQRRARADRN